MESAYFSEIITDKFLSRVIQKLNLDIKFEKIGIKLTPLALEFKNISVEKESSKEAIFGRFDSLRLDFDIIDLIAKNKISIEHVKLQKGLVTYRNKNPKGKRENLNIESVLKNIIALQDVYPNFIYGQNKISIYGLSFNEVDLVYDKTFASIHNSSLWRSKRGWHFNFVLGEMSSDVLDLNLESIDSISGNLSLTENKIIFNKFLLLKKLDKLEATGSLAINDSDLTTDLNIKFEGDGFETLRSYFPKQQELVGVEGLTKINTKVKLENKKYRLEGNVELQDFRSKYGNGENLKADFSFVEDIISVKKAVYKNRGGTLRTNYSFKLFDTKNKKFILNVLNINSKDLNLRDALFVVPELYPLLGKLNGNIDIIFSDEKVFFYGQDGLRVDDFSLKFDSETPVLINDSFDLPKLEISLFPNFDVSLDIGAKFPNSEIKAKGYIKEKVFIETYDSIIDLEKLGPISGVQLKGRGPISMIVEGKDEVSLDFNFSPLGFSLLGFNFGKAISSFQYQTQTNKLVISSFDSKLGGTKINGLGEIDFDNDSNINLDIKIDGANAIDTESILERFFKNKSLLSSSLYIEYNSSFKVFGKAGKDDVRIKGNLASNNLKLMEEEFDSFKTSFMFKDDTLSLSNLNLSKSKGSLRGKVDYNFKKDSTFYNLSLEKVELSEFKYYSALNLGVNGFLYGRFKGSGFISNPTSELILELRNSSIGDLSLPSSKLSLAIKNKDLLGHISFLGTIGQGQISINFDKESKKRSEFNFDLNSQDLGILAGVISENNLTNKNIFGQLNFNMTGDFDFYNLKDLNAELNVKRFNFQKNSLKYNLNNQKRSILIEKGKVLDWGLEVIGEDQYFSSSATGDMISGFRVENNFSLEGELLEIFGPSFKKVRGKINGKLNLLGNYKKFNPDFSFYADNVSLNSTYIPGVFEGINFKTSVNKKEIIIHNIQGKYNGGDFKSDGVLLFRIPFPIIKLNYSLNNTKFSAMKKSSFIVSGTGKIEGDKTPYNLYGDLYIPFGKVNDSLDELLKKRGVTDDFSVFLPGKRDLDKLEKIKLNLNVDITKPVIIRNNISELSFLGKLNIYGHPSNPLIKGSLNFAPSVSKFIFKGNEFALTEGRINFIENEIKLDPEFRFVGSSRINEYDIRISANGRGRDLDFKLSSEPTLGQEDILSLLTLGVTSQTSKNLQAKDRESLTSIGIGSLIMDQFQINEGLSSTLGLRLSVTPEFSDENEIDPLSSRSSSTGGAASKVRSATRIKIKKKITDNLDMSLSSTVGGSIEQKQEMNIDYNINKNILLQGIYEVKSTNEQEASEDPTSVGADIRFRWFFK